MVLTEQEVDALRKSLPAVCKHQDVIRAAESTVLEKLKAQEPYAIEVSEDDGGSFELVYPAAVTKYNIFAPDQVTRLLYTHPLPPDDVVRDAERWRMHIKLYSEHIGVPEEDVIDMLDAAMEKRK